MIDLSLPQKIAIWALPVILAITIHEVAHGWVAERFGDQTARLQGRITLNPFKHIDPIGTLLVPAVLLALGGYVFGWAKPVPVDYRNLRNPRRDSAIVAAAGPMANLGMAILWTLLLHISATMTQTTFAMWLGYTSAAGIMINTLLMLFNLLPIPPLDGSVVLASFLKGRALYYYSMVGRFGFFILIGLILSGVLFYVIGPAFNGLLSFFFGLSKIGMTG
jgi:Zn-dependent protease